MNNKKKFFIFWLILIFITPLVYLSFDFFISKIIVKNEKSLEKKESKQYWRKSHPVYHHTFEANIDVVQDNGKFGKSKIFTNSLGFRDKEVRKIKLNKDKHRIVFIGDSFTEGVLLNYENTFVGIIDKELSNYNIETLNAGVTSYNPSIYYTKTKYFIDKKFQFDELVVFIDISDVQDEALDYKIENSIVKLRKKKKPKKNIIDFLKKNFFVTYSIANFIHDTFVPTVNKEDISYDEFIKFIVSDKYKTDKWTIDKDLFKKYEIGLERNLKHMKLLKKLCDDNNIKMTIAVYPWFSQIYHDDLDSLHVKIWSDFSKKNNINFINYFPYFFKKNLNLEERIKIIKKYYIPFDIHFNSKGNERIAEVFLQKYLK